MMSFDFKTKQWNYIACNQPEGIPSVDSHSAVLWNKDDNTSTMIMLGGFVGGEVAEYSNGVFEYNFKENAWTTLARNRIIESKNPENLRIPQGRMSFGACIHNNILYMFGGNNSNHKFNDLWKFNLLTKKWSLVRPANPVLPEV